MIQPSLRDFSDPRPEPGSELPGYFQVSLRENPQTAPPKWCEGPTRCIPARWREDDREGWRSFKNSYYDARDFSKDIVLRTRAIVRLRTEILQSQPILAGDSETQDAAIEIRQSSVISRCTTRTHQVTRGRMQTGAAR